MKKGQKKYEISGGFHDADPIFVWADPDMVDINGILDALSDVTAKRVMRHMCGHRDCLCGSHHGWIIERVR
jgi:hypothetical protein